jgi:hypothetical protein
MKDVVEEDLVLGLEEWMYSQREGDKQRHFSL